MSKYNQTIERQFTTVKSFFFIRIQLLNKDKVKLVTIDTNIYTVAVTM